MLSRTKRKRKGGGKPLSHATAGTDVAKALSAPAGAFESSDQPNADLEYFESLRAHRLSTLQLVNDQTKTFDKAVLSLSSGAFGLSLLFIDKLGGDTHYARNTLVMAWVCFLLAMLSNLISYHTSAASALSEVTKVDECLRTASEYSALTNRYRTCTHILNLAALLLFTLGASALAYFAFANI